MFFSHLNILLSFITLIRQMFFFSSLFCFLLFSYYYPSQSLTSSYDDDTISDTAGEVLEKTWLLEDNIWIYE
jgi:hypothetical protein